MRLTKLDMHQRWHCGFFACRLLVGHHRHCCRHSSEVRAADVLIQGPLVLTIRLLFSWSRNAISRCVIHILPLRAGRVVRLHPKGQRNFEYPRPFDPPSLPVQNVEGPRTSTALVDGPRCSLAFPSPTYSLTRDKPGHLQKYNLTLQVHHPPQRSI